MSEHSLILEFYKPTYNLDFDYNGDGGLDLHFTNIKGEFFMTMNDSYDSVYIEDEDCEFSKGEMFATVDLGDLVERIIMVNSDRPTERQLVIGENDSSVMVKNR